MTVTVEESRPSAKIGEALPRAHFMVPVAARTLKRFYLLQRELVLMQAGWLPAAEHWQSKLLLPEFLWQDSQTAAQCRERVLELRYPEREIDSSEDEPLLALWRKFADAPHGIAFVDGLRHIIKPLLRRSYRRYLELTDALDDGPTVRILRQAVQDIDEQLERWDEAAHDALVSRPDQEQSTTEWMRGAKQLGEAIGDLLAMERSYEMPFDAATFGGRPFEISRTGQRDSRFNVLKFPWPDSLDPAAGPGDGLQLQIRQAIHHINEVWAAEMAGACLYDLANEASPEFLTDAARWCYDEIRHCRMGSSRLHEWGFKPADIPLGAFSYDAGAQADALTRLGIIFYFESTYIGTKSQRMKYFGEFGDKVSSHDMDFDWADEQIHTHYGTRWLKYFLDQRDDTRKPIEFRPVAEGCIAAIRAEATPQDRAATAAAFEHMMAKARQLAVETVSA